MMNTFEAYRASLQASNIPENMHYGIARYLSHGIMPGHFLAAVLSNDLREACARADDTNRHLLFEYVYWLYNVAPGGSWGSADAVARWTKRPQGQMTYDAFLAKLRATPREGWAVDTDDCIRFKSEVCPITAAGGHFYPDVQWEACASALGLEPELAKTIMASADESIGCDYRMRRDLMEACGLLDPAQPAPQEGAL